MAARAANSEKLTEEIGRVFKLLLEQITEAYELCLQKRRVTECCVQQCRSLLKPWPVRSTAENKGRETCKQEASRCSTTSDTHKEEKNVESKAEEAEKHDLAALDQLLAKAQRAREIQNKIDEPGVTASHKTKVVKKPRATGNKVPVQQPAKQMPVKTVKPASKQSVSTKKPPAKKAPVRSTYSASYGRPISARSFSRQPPSSRGRTSAKVFLDNVMKRDTGEHLSHSDGKEKAIAGPLTHRKQLPRPTGESKDTQPKEVKPEKEQLSHSSTAVYCPETTNQYQENQKQNGLISSSELEVNIDGNGRCEVAMSHTSKGACQSVLSHANPFEPVNDRLALSKSGAGLCNQKEGVLDPFAEGASLSLPSKYRKLKSTSAGLYAELRKVLEKEDRRSFCQHFVDRLEARFDLESLSTHKEIHEQACHVIQEHEKLTRLAEDVVRRSCNLTDASLWQETYKCYRLWQIILSKFNELQRRTQLLLEAEEQLSSSCPCGNCNAFDRDIPRDTAFARERAHPRGGCILLSKWLPEGIENDVAAESFDRTPQKELTYFTYNSVKELQKLVRLHHEVQLLHFQLYLEEQAGDKLLPLLERLDPSEGLFVPLYRVIYGLLCGGGKVFPTMVLDTFT